MEPSPVTVTGNVFYELAELRNKSGDHALALKRIEKKAEKLKSSNPAEGFSILGAVACVRKDFDNMHKYHKLSLKSYPSVISYFNYACSLEKASLLVQAINMAEQAHEIDRTDVRSIDLLIELCVAAGFENDAGLYNEKRKDLTGNDHELFVFPEDDSEILTKMIDLVEEQIASDPSVLVEVDDDFFSYGKSLVEGVEID